MRYAWLIAWREYSENAKTKGFWLGLFLMPLILFLSIQVPIWLDQKATPAKHFVLVDQSGQFAPVITANLERARQQKVLEALRVYARKYADPAAVLPSPDPLAEFSETNAQALDAFLSKGGQAFFLAQLRSRLRSGAPPFDEPRRSFVQVPLPPGINPRSGLGDIVEKLKPYLRGEQRVEVDGRPASLAAAILIPRDVSRQIIRPAADKTLHGTPDAPGGNTLSPARADAAPADPIEYWSVDASDFHLRDQIQGWVNAEVRRREYLARGLDTAAIHAVEQTYIPFRSLDPKKAKGKETISSADTIRQWAPSGFVYLLWLAIFVITQMLLNNTIDEKSNRIIEVLLSSVTPDELMMGKLFGIAAIGLTMVGAWLLALFGILSWKAGGAELARQVLSVLKGSNLVPLFCIYFLLGYLMYAALILSVGSVCNTIKEAQNYMGLLTVLMIVPLLTMTFIPRAPNGSVARLLSWIPLYTPFIMMNRAMADPPLVDLAGTLALLVLATAGALWMSGRIFRVGILRTGQPPRLLEMIRWATRRDT